MSPLLIAGDWQLHVCGQQVQVLHGTKQAKICAIQLAHAVLLTQQGPQCEVHYLLWAVGNYVAAARSATATAAMPSAR